MGKDEGASELVGIWDFFSSGKGDIEEELGAFVVLVQDGDFLSS